LVALGPQAVPGGLDRLGLGQGASHVPFLLSGLRPRIENELGPDIASAIFTQNPARAFAAQWRQP
jgi:phosphotriesterase-related protein